METNISETVGKAFADIDRIAESYGVSEVWLFGSAVDPRENYKPNDIDVALLGVPVEEWDGLVKVLIQRFSTSRVVCALGYDVNTNPPIDELPFDFVLATTRMRNSHHPIFQSIGTGRCLIGRS